MLIFIKLNPGICKVSIFPFFLTLFLVTQPLKEPKKKTPSVALSKLFDQPLIYIYYFCLCGYIELCRIGTEEQNEWYFFSHKDKKYPTGTRTNRATKAGFWKATGRDKAIYSRRSLIGMRKTLVFYKGRAPNGQKSDWIMHEYRQETNENGTPQVSKSTYYILFIM